MGSILDINEARTHGILSSVAGFPFILMFGFTWIVAGVLSYMVQLEIVPWVYRTNIYGFLAVVIALGPFILGLLVGWKMMNHYTGFFVGATLLIGAYFARLHATATWMETQRISQPGDDHNRKMSDE